MKKLLLILNFLFIVVYVFSQSGGNSQHKIKLSNYGTVVRATQFNADGTIRPLANGSENQIYQITNGIPVWRDHDDPVIIPQTLSGTSPTYDASVSLNANMTLTGTSTITMTNLPVGKRGDLYVVHANDGYVYTITLTGYTFNISQAIWKTGNTLLVKSSGGKNIYSWYYNGSVVIITGQTDLKGL